MSNYNSKNRRDENSVIWLYCKQFKYASLAWALFCLVTGYFIAAGMGLLLAISFWGVQLIKEAITGSGKKVIEGKR